MFIHKLNQLAEAFGRIDRELGLRKFIRYVLVIAIGALLVPVAIHPKESIKETVRFFLELSIEIENDRMKERETVIRELRPLLRELRAETDADRVVYYEYHNSIENEAGVPFKFVDLVQQAPRMGLPELSPISNVNVSRFADLYCDLRDTGCVVNQGDSTFYYRYPGFSEITNGSKRQVFVGIPGIQLPLGIVVLEWYDDDPGGIPEIDKVRSKALKESLRINALMSKVTSKK